MLKMTVFKLQSYLHNSKSYYPILMSFGMIVKNDKSKTKMGSQENWSKVKVTGQGYRDQLTIKNDCLQAVTQKITDRF